MVDKSSTGIEASERRKSGIGVFMTILYSVIYGGFVGLSVFDPILMGRSGLFGMNLAVTYGLGLIIGAVVFAVVYNQLVCGSPSRSISPAPDGSKTGIEE